ncbi:MAG TPA: GxxExxY protein [Gemmatimonadaceae bacterium]|nr:GxxExxY protein [Gemmatimonadaceae bacterium]
MEQQHKKRFDGERLTQAIIGAAIEVHTILGPGLLESAYQDCLCYELEQLGLKFECQPYVPFRYKAIQIDRVFRPDLIVEKSIILELKSVEKILPIHEAQVQTYLKLAELKTGLIFNFNTHRLKDGIRRVELYSRPSLQKDVSHSPVSLESP